MKEERKPVIIFLRSRERIRCRDVAFFVAGSALGWGIYKLLT